MTKPGDMVIAAEQVAERDRWERLLVEGKANLFDALIGMLSTGAPATPYLLQRLTQAEIAYKDHAIEDLAEAFGIAMSKSEKNAMNRQTILVNVRHVVDAMHEKGMRLAPPTYYEENNAFCAVAGVLGCSATHLYDLYYRKGSKKPV